MIQQTTELKPKGVYDLDKTIARIRKDYKKHFGKSITTTQVRKMWKDYVDIQIVPELSRGKKVQLDALNSLEVIGRPLTTNDIALMKNGLYAGEQGSIVKMNRFNFHRAGYSYKITYRHVNQTQKLYFDAHPNIKEAVHLGLGNRANVFRIND